MNFAKNFAGKESTVTFANTKFGMWRSLVAYSSGGRGVASSNLVIPTIKNLYTAGVEVFFFHRSRNEVSGER